MMKKKMLVLAILGIILVVGGGIGAAINFQAAEKQVTTVTDERYKLKSKDNQKKLALVLDINNQYTGKQVDVQIEPSGDSQFHLYNKSFSSKSPITLKWDISEKNGQTEVNIHYTEAKQRESYFSIDPWNFDYSPITLQVPMGYEDVEVTSTNNQHYSLNLGNLKTKNMTLTNLEGQTHLYGIQTNTLSATNESGSLSLVDSRINDDLKIDSDAGYISLETVVAETVDIKTNDGAIRLYDVIAKTKLESEYGDINLTDIVGVTQAKTARGMIDFDQEMLKNDLDFSTESGDIRILLEEKSTKFDVMAKTDTGRINIFGEASEQPFKEADGPKVKLTSDSGNITMTTYEADNYGDDYYDDFDDEDFE